MTTKGSEGPKVTECWTVEAGDGSPVLHWVFDKKDSYHPAAAILMWREDYDALRESLKHREELYWKLTAEFDAMRKELEELKGQNLVLYRLCRRHEAELESFKNDTITISGTYQVAEAHDDKKAK